MQTISRSEAKVIFGTHRGAARRLALELGMSPVSVSQWLNGRMTSAKLEEAVLRRAAELSGLGGVA